MFLTPVNLPGSSSGLKYRYIACLCRIADLGTPKLPCTFPRRLLKRVNYSTPLSIECATCRQTCVQRPPDVITSKAKQVRPSQFDRQEQPACAVAQLHKQHTRHIRVVVVEGPLTGGGNQSQGQLSHKISPPNFQVP